MARLVNTFLNRDVSIEEWQIGRQALLDNVEAQVFFDWFQEQSDLNQLGDSDYIQTLIQNTLQRPATTEEISGYLLQLEEGTFSRDGVAVDIASSEEAITVIGSVIEIDGGV